MLEKQMLLESKRLEEKGININEAGNKNLKNNIKKKQENKKFDEEQENISIIKTSENSKNNLNTSNLIIIDVNDDCKNKKNIKTETKPIEKKPKINENKSDDIKKKDEKVKKDQTEDDDDKNGKLNKEEIENNINSLLGSEIAGFLESDKWNERKEKETRSK